MAAVRLSTRWSDVNQINVQVWQRDSDEPIEFEDINYISLVSNETYGIPALIAEERVKTEGLPVRILYINPANVAAIEAERIA